MDKRPTHTMYIYIKGRITGFVILPSVLIDGMPRHVKYLRPSLSSQRSTREWRWYVRKWVARWFCVGRPTSPPSEKLSYLWWGNQIGVQYRRKIYPAFRADASLENGYIRVCTDSSKTAWYVQIRVPLKVIQIQVFVIRVTGKPTEPVGSWRDSISCEDFSGLTSHYSISFFPLVSFLFMSVFHDS